MASRAEERRERAEASSITQLPARHLGKGR